MKMTSSTKTKPHIGRQSRRGSLCHIYGDDLKYEDNRKYEDNSKYEDNRKYKDNRKYEDNLMKKTSRYK